MRRVAAFAASSVAVSFPVLAPTAALAQKWSLDTGVATQLTWSSNSELGVAEGREDTILNVRPRVALRGEGARLRVTGAAALNAVTSANGTQPSRVLPEADLDARLEAVERFLFLDAGVRAVQTSVDPFGARPEPASSLNRLTTAQLRLSPSIESAVDANTRYRLRSDNSWTRESGAAAAATAAEGYFGRHSALFERDPRPLGWRIEAERSQTRYRDGIEDPLTLDLVRLTVNYALGADWSAGVRAGRERTSLRPDDPENTLYGVQARWRPSPRTTLDVFEEKRFFGSSWRLAFDHRMPRLAWNLLLSRSLDTTPQALFELPATDNVSALLDAVLTTRFPDPAERASVVRDLIAREGLPAQTLGPISLFAQRLSLVTQRSASVALIGARNTLTVGAFQSRTEDASEGGALVTGEALTNNLQRGASIALSHRLTPAASMNVSADWSRIRAIRSPERSTQRTARLQFNVQATPRTNTFAGARYRDLESNVAAEGREGAVFIGLDHRF